MNVAYNQINCQDASRIIGVDYTTVVGWCHDGKINSTNISEGTTRGRYMITEEEVDYLKMLKQKFGKQFIRRYRKDWQRGKQPAQTETDVKPIAIIKDFQYADTDSVKPVKEKADIDELAIKIGYIQDLKEQIAKLQSELETLRKEVMEYL